MRASLGRRLAVLLAFALLGPSAVGLAQSWTVQTAAFRDDRQALAVVAELRALGVEAYREFAMDDGRQFSRVRVGCWASRDGAASFAEALRGRVTAEAVPVPLSAGAPLRVCARREVGFLKPARWELTERTPAALTFRVEVGDREGYVRLDGDRWIVLQAFAPAPSAAGSAGARFVQLETAGAPLVARRDGGVPLALCAGRLLGQTPRAAVVEEDGAVVACLVEER